MSYWKNAGKYQEAYDGLYEDLCEGRKWNELHTNKARMLELISCAYHHVMTYDARTWGEVAMAYPELYHFRTDTHTPQSIRALFDKIHTDIVRFNAEIADYLDKTYGLDVTPYAEDAGVPSSLLTEACDELGEDVVDDVTDALAELKMDYLQPELMDDVLSMVVKHVKKHSPHHS